MKRIATAVFFFFSVSIFSGCATMQQGSSSESNVGYCAVGGVLVGGLAGAATRPKKPKENALIGAIIGGVSGYVICTLIENEAKRAAIQAAQTNQRVDYTTTEGRRVVATPAARTSSDGCKEITNEAWDTDKTYLGKITRKVCPDSNGKLEVRT